MARQGFCHESPQGYHSRVNQDKDHIVHLLGEVNSENFPEIIEVAKRIEQVGTKHNATAGQVTLTWTLAQGDDLVVIPGTKKVKYAKENMGAAKVKLSANEIATVRKISE
ncbi:hypothetical protein BDP27DRAFT_1446462 [Rhodocollybia butyracea]|uniref:NADP-dependent oxidoreductase domain-containing protein n=1 Tax=Rhodocollybia butyracea TaxID=206335 RepID=A0A9P5U9N2_9AGAR|nr:hypothetical protein BDP27DRAFT_1446462 [Rhodocollybia butyracea]